MKTTTKLLALLLAVCMLACLMAGCAKPETQDTKDPVTLPETNEDKPVVDAPAEEEKDEEESTAVTVADMTGREITLEKPADRIVALTASDCEIIYALGAGDKLVGRGEYCDYPAEVMDVPSVQSGYDTNIEQILALEPQVLVMSTMAQSEEQIQQLENAGVKVVVSDGQGGTATRTWTFTRTNSAPTISGSDGNLGDKNLGFTYAYTIDDADGDTLTVVEELNDETIRTINNAPKGEELTVTITSEKLYALGLNSVNTLKITVTDGKGGTAYRRVTFKRTNSAPTISGQDKALGLKNGSFAENYTVSDVEGDNVVVTEFVDDVQIRSYQATLGQQETIELTREKWLSLTNGQHQLRIEAVDGNFATSVRVFSFSKKETVIKFELVAPEETDAAATKVLVTPTWKIEGAVAKVEACNNGFDAVPTWEDITAMVQINRVYNFTNKTKTASKWGVNIRFTITKNEGFEGEVSISGFGGAYE